MGSKTFDELVADALKESRKEKKESLGKVLADGICKISTVVQSLWWFALAFVVCTLKQMDVPGMENVPWWWASAPAWVPLAFPFVLLAVVVGGVFVGYLIIAIGALVGRLTLWLLRKFFDLFRTKD